MNPLDFLAVVLPSPGHGYYCVTELSTRKKEHQFDTELAALEEHITRWDSKNNDIYFALGTFEEAGSREAANAAYMKSLFIDMDGYETKKAAAQELNAFLSKTGIDLLGTPYIVGSGGGLHVYWPLDVEVPISRWKPVAEGLKRLAKQEGLRIDMTVTADAARVLRVPGTRNHKRKYPSPRAVRILAEGDTFALEDIEALITSQLKSPVPALPTASMPALVLDGERPTTSVKTSSTLAPLLQNTETHFASIYRKTKDGSGCAQLRSYVENASDDGMEPLWRAWLSIAQKCDDGDRAVIWLTDLHPYTHERMHQKLAEIKGPYPCLKFDSENPGVCDDCMHRGKITNPLALGRQLAAVAEPTVVEATNEATDAPETIMRPEPPTGYVYGKKGGVFMEREMPGEDGENVKRHIMLCQYDVFPVEILNNNGVHEVHIKAIRNGRVQDVAVQQKHIASKSDTIQQLASQNIMASFGSGNDKNFYEYIRACVEKLSVERTPILLPGSYGWQDNDTFVFASRIYSAHKPPITVPLTDMENITSNTTPKGTLDDWRRAVNVLIRRELWDHLAVFLFGVGAALMRFTGFHGMTVHCASRESGTGKTLALETAASFWGHPIHYRTGAGTSAVAMQQRLGLLRSMPLVTDEITTNNRLDFEWFPAFLLSMTDGRGKERMEAGTNRERLNLSVWATMALMSSNRNAVDYLAGERQHSSEGELRRLLEFSMDTKLEWTQSELQDLKLLQNNYGVAAEVLAQYMVDNVEMLKTLVLDTMAKMYEYYRAANDERFWMAGAAAAVAAGIVLNSQHAKIIDIPMQEIMKATGRAVNNMRTAIRGNILTGVDILNRYIQEYQGKMVVVKRNDKSGVLAHFQDGTEVGRNTTRQQIMGRVEAGFTPGYTDFFVEERQLRAFCSVHSFSYTKLKEDIEKDFRVQYHKRKNLTARTDAPPMRVSVIQISMREDEADEELIQHLSLGSSAEGAGVLHPVS